MDDIHELVKEYYQEFTTEELMDWQREHKQEVIEAISSEAKETEVTMPSNEIREVCKM